MIVIPSPSIDASFPSNISNRALFLDRDGVINVDHGWVHKHQDIAWVEGIFELAQAAHRGGWKLIVVTNQGGIARGFFRDDDFRQLSLWMMQEFAHHGAPLSLIVGCPHHPSGAVPALSIACTCRKPEPGMILHAAQRLKVDLTRSALIGDNLTDMQAARAAGVGMRLLLSHAAPRAPAALEPDDWIDHASLREIMTTLKL